MITAHELLRTAAALPIEVVEVEEDDTSPEGSIRMVLRIPEDDVCWGSIPLLFALGVLSYAEARPRGVCDMHFNAADEWRVTDLVEHIQFERGHLRLTTDYVRGRMMKTSVDVAPDGTIHLRVANRASSAKRWVSMLQGHGQHVGLVEVVDEPMGRFYAPTGDLLRTLDDWEVLHPPRHWKDGRSAKLLAEVWGGAGGFPASVREALDRVERLRDLEFDQGLVEHKTEAPGRGAASQTDILVFATDPLGNSVVLAVEGKVDEGFAQPISKWLEAGKSPSSPASRRRRIDDMLIDLCIDPKTEGVDALPYQLVHRAWAALQEASNRMATRGVFVVHSFTEPHTKGAGWNEFRSFARLLRFEGKADLEVGVPFHVQVIDGVDLWMVWVPEPLG